MSLSEDHAIMNLRTSKTCIDIGVCIDSSCPFRRHLIDYLSLPWPISRLSNMSEMFNQIGCNSYPLMQYLHTCGQPNGIPRKVRLWTRHGDVNIPPGLNIHRRLDTLSHNLMVQLSGGSKCVATGKRI